MADLGELDVLIIGGGMGGCIVATGLAEHGVHPETGKRLRIAILERGPHFKGDTRPGYGIPLRRQLFTSNTPENRASTRYTMASGLSQAERDRKTRRRYVNTRRGDASAIGGGSLHWQCNTQVPFDLDYGAYAAETGVDWTVDKLRPASEDIQRLFNIHSRPDSLLTPGDFMFRDAAQALGHKVIPLTLAKRNCIGCSFCNLMCKYDAKMGPLITHVPLAEKLGVQIIPEAEVEKIILEKQGARVVAKGAIYRHQGETQSVMAGKALVACGTHGTPALLFRSGYGRRDVLGSDLVVENDNVGNNVDAKVATARINAVFDQDIHDGEYRDGTFDLFHDIHDQGYFDRLQVNFRVTRLPRDPYALATDQSAPEFGREHKEFMRDVYILQRPHRVRAEYLKRGSIGISLARPSGVLGKMDAYLDLEYDRTDPGTLRRLREGHEIGLEILKKMGARAISESEDGVRITNVSGISSSCRAGSDRSNSVVNSDFESHDVDNLLICDQSVQPRIASRGFGSPVAMFATYATQRMVANYFS